MPPLPPSSDFTGASVTEGGFKAAINELRAYLAGLLDATGNPADALAALGALGAGVLVKSAGYAVTPADRGRIILADGSWSLSLPAAADAGAGFVFALRNVGTGTITIAPTGVELIDDAVSLALGRGGAALIVSTGTGWISLAPPVQTGALDTVPGRLLTVGAFGLGVTGATPDIPDLAATDTPSGQYRYTQASIGYASLPAAIAGGASGLVDVARHDAGLLIQTARAVDLAGGLWWRAHADGAWNAWRRILDQPGIVGPVSQSAGMPTGAVIERGQNANGDYVRLADGTQICTQALSIGYYSGSTLSGSWTYPASFASSAGLVVSGMINMTASSIQPGRDELAGFDTNSPGTTGVDFRLARISGMTNFDPADTLAINAIAVGRWFV